MGWDPLLENISVSKKLTGVKSGTLPYRIKKNIIRCEILEGKTYGTVPYLSNDKVSPQPVLWIRNYFFFRIRIRLFRKFRIRTRPNFSARRQNQNFKENCKRDFKSLPIPANFFALTVKLTVTSGCSADFMLF